MIKPLQAVAVKVSAVGSTHMTPAENYYSQAQLDQLTQDLANTQAEIARLRGYLHKIGKGVSSQAESQLIADEALSQSSPSLALQGWKLVPIEPTNEMLMVARNAPLPCVMLDSISANIDLKNKTAYKAMLSASPTNMKG